MNIYKGDGDINRMINVDDPNDKHKPNSCEWVKLTDVKANRFNAMVIPISIDFETIFGYDFEPEYSEELAVGETTELIRDLLCRGIMPQIGWQLNTKNFDEMTLNRITVADDYWQFVFE